MTVKQYDGWCHCEKWQFLEISSPQHFILFLFHHNTHNINQNMHQNHGYALWLPKHHIKAHIYIYVFWYLYTNIPLAARDLLVYCSTVIYTQWIGYIGPCVRSLRNASLQTTIWTIISKSSSLRERARPRCPTHYYAMLLRACDVYLSDYENTCVLRCKRMNCAPIYIGAYICWDIRCVHVAQCLRNAIWCRGGEISRKHGVYMN